VLIASVLMLGGCFLFSNPHAQFSFTPKRGYPPLIVHFDGSESSSPNGTIRSYKWNFDDDGTETGEFVDYTFYKSGTHSVTLTVMDSTGAFGVVAHDVQVLNHAPQPQFAWWPTNPQPQSLTEFDATESSDEDGYIVDWQWSFGDGITGSGSLVHHAYDSNETYEVTLTVTDDDGEAASLTRNVTVGCPGCGG